VWRSRRATSQSTQLIEVVDKIYGAYNVKAVEGAWHPLCAARAARG